MFIAQTSLRSLWRNRTKNALVVIVGALIVLLLNLYMGNIRSGQKQIQALASTLSIRADIANQNGSQITALNISDDTVRFLENSSYVKDLRYLVVLQGGLGTFAPKDWEANLKITLSAVNDLSVLSGLSADKIDYGSGLNRDFLRGDQPQCLVYEGFAHHNKLSIGDAVQFTLYYIEYPAIYEGRVNLNPLGVYDLTVAGIIWPTIWDSGATTQDVVLPAGWLRRAYAENNVAFAPTSLSFNVADPVKLNAFKAEMNAFGFRETDPTAAQSYNGDALKVNDKIFINACNLLEENQSRLRFFLPIILAILLFTGYLTSSLLMRNRRREYAVMRSLGTGRHACFCIFLLENALLALCGALLGALAAALLIPSADATVLLLAAAAYCACDLFGTAIALSGLSRFSVMDVLCQTD